MTIVFPPSIRLITFSVYPCKERQKKDGKTSNFKFRLFADFILGENWDYILLVNSGARSLKVAAMEPWSLDFLALEPWSPAFLGPEPWSPKPLWDPDYFILLGKRYIFLQRVGLKASTFIHVFDFVKNQTIVQIKILNSKEQMDKFLSVWKPLLCLISYNLNSQYLQACM